MRVATVLVSLALFTGCVNEAAFMRPAGQNTIKAPQAELAQLTFMRSSSTWAGGKIMAAIYDVTDGTPSFVGMIPNDTKLTLSIKPGQHRYMVYCDEAADFMNIDAAAGRSYFTMVTPRSGALTFRFSFRPIRNAARDEFSYSHANFTKWLVGTTLVENSPESVAWEQKVHANMLANMDAYLPKWLAKPEAERLEQSVNAEDFLSSQTP